MSQLSMLRTRLRSTPVLVDYFQAHYQTEARHFIGYKRAPSARDFPYIAYVSNRQELIGDIPDSELVSLVIGVNEPDMTDDVFDGVARLDEIQAIIVPLLDNIETDSGYVWVEGKITVRSDFQMRHPYHERELQFLIKWQE